MKCIIDGCESRRNENTTISFHRIRERVDWVEAIKTLNGQDVDLNSGKELRICSKHFEASYILDICTRKQVLHGAVPTIFPKLFDFEHVELLLPSNAGESEIQPRLPSVKESGSLLNRAPLPRRGRINLDIDKATPRSLRKYTKSIKTLLEIKNKQIKKVRRQIVYKEKKLKNLNLIIKELRRTNMLTENAAEVLRTYDNKLLKTLSNGKIRGKYPVDLRSFALTLHFYSPRAYSYVRSLYKINLPAPSTLRAWYSKTEVSAGVTQKSLEILTLKCISSENLNRKLVACLMMDEMAIRQHIEWDDINKKYVGTIDFGTNISSTEELPPAKEALVYLLVGLNGSWKLPVAFFFLNGLSSSERANLTRHVLWFLENSKVEIVGLTFDGHPANISMIEHLGGNMKEFKPRFETNQGKTIPIFLDACHCLKLIRNTWGTKKIFTDKNGDQINWQFIVNLVQYQEKLGLHVANKLNANHLNWHSKIMNVKLAAQTLSESTANSLAFLLQSGLKEFQGCEATIVFVKTINNIFDVLNSRSRFGYGFKKGLCYENYVQYSQFFNESINYISHLKIGDSRIIHSKNKVGFIGFISDLKNFKFLYEEYVEKEKVLSYILSYKLSQDHLELFFSSIRSRGGFNNNPTATQFVSAYKRLLIHNEVYSSADANCISIDDTSILNTSSSKVTTCTESDFSNFASPDFNLSLELDDIPIEYIINNEFNEIVMYISGFVEKKLISSLDCTSCKFFFLNNCEVVNSKLISMKSKGFLKYPHKDTVKICQTVQKVISLYEIKEKLKAEKTYRLIQMSTLRTINLNALYIELKDHILDCDVQDNHIYFIVKKVINIYCKVIMHYIAKKSNLKDHKKLVRSKFTKIVQFMGQ